MFEPVESRRTFEDVVEQIAEKIRGGELHAGDRLPSERTMAEQLDVSRPTVREAVLVLVKAGLLDVKPGSQGGAFVRSAYVPPQLIRSRFRMRVSEVAGVLEARRLLEPRVAQLASLHATEADLDALRTTIERQRELAPSVDRHEHRFLQLDVQFHLGLARATRNATIVRLMRGLFDELEMARELAIHLPPAAEWAVDVHERTLAAVRAGDLQRIEDVMDEHLSVLEQTWEQESSRALVRPLPEFLLPVAQRSGARPAAPARSD